MGVIAALVVAFLVAAVPRVWAEGADPWLTVEDHAVRVESSGWSFPVEIAFVPEPGPGPKDPLYYVTELRGTIKVVTNDRTVSVYAEDVVGYRPPVELPNKYAEVGLAGLCLDGARGLLFATTVYFQGGQIHNKIVRFEHADGRLGLRPKASREFTEIFAETPSGVSHQIGKCVIGKDGMLYVGVGDGNNPKFAQRLDNPNGKILRMRTDFEAPPDNPFYDPAHAKSVRSYIYAHGLRNPFAIATDGQGTIYVAENGVDTDRLIEIVAGRNYLWDGTTESTGAQGIWYWRRSVGPAGMAYVPANGFFPEWGGRLIVAQGGLISRPGPGRGGRTSLAGYLVRRGEGLQELPRTLVWYSGSQLQLPVPVALGPDGIYFSGFFPDAQGETTILKVVAKKGARPRSAAMSGEELFREKACEGCHSLQGWGGAVGPALDGLVDRLEKRLESSEYRAQLNNLEASTDPALMRFKEVRKSLSSKEGEDLVRAWIKLRLEEPRFDMPQAAMPNPNLSSGEIERITDYLMTLRVRSRDVSWFRRAKDWWYQQKNAIPLTAFVAGILVTLGAQSAWRRARRIGRFRT